MTTRTRWTFGVSAAGMILALFFALGLAAKHRGREGSALSGFSLVDHAGKRFDAGRLQGKWTFLVFGFTHCPDVCPMSLSLLAQVQKRLGEEREDRGAQFVFVSVDPERDTPERLAQYVTSFGEQFVAVTGEQAEIRNVIEQLGAFAQPREPRSDFSLIDHTALIYLFDPDGRLAAEISSPRDVKTITTTFRDAARRYSAAQGTSDANQG